MEKKRFQIQLLVDESDYLTIKQWAERDSRSIASWVRIQLKAAINGLRQGSPKEDDTPGKKIWEVFLKKEEGEDLNPRNTLDHEDDDVPF